MAITDLHTRPPVPRRAVASITPSWPLHGRPARSSWRLLAAVGAFGEAVAHIPVIEEHLSEAPYIGVCFVLLTISGFVLGNYLLNADSQAVWVATGVVSALALLGYLLSRTVGLPQIGDDVGSWSDPLGIVAISCEALMLATASLQIRNARTNRSHPDR